MKRYFKFDDNSIALLPVDYKFTFKPTHIYSSNMLGFGVWEIYNPLDY